MRLEHNYKTHLPRTTAADNRLRLTGSPCSSHARHQLHVKAKTHNPPPLKENASACWALLWGRLQVWPSEQTRGVPGEMSYLHTHPPCRPPPKGDLSREEARQPIKSWQRSCLNNATSVLPTSVGCCRGLAVLGSYAPSLKAVLRWLVHVTRCSPRYQTLRVAGEPGLALARRRHTSNSGLQSHRAQAEVFAGAPRSVSSDHALSVYTQLCAGVWPYLTDSHHRHISLVTQQTQ